MAAKGKTNQRIPLDRWLANRHRRGRIALVAVVVGVGLMLLVRVVVGPAGDWRQYDRHTCRVTEIGNAMTLALDEPRTTARLLGVEPAPDAAGEARRHVEQAIAGRPVMLVLGGPNSRDRAGNLLAYVYTADGEMLNASLIAAGLATAANTPDHDLFDWLERTEGQARVRRRGIWAESESP